ncbi:MAG TPA: hypothetical protein VMT93_00310 [Gemmatimonadaceae bacterium]|nr:hypothetical protein [Gemmatimonadaceae bacterium]
MRRGTAAAVFSAVLAAAFAGAARAQLPFDGKTGWRTAPIAQAWSFGCCSNDSSAASLKSASEFTIPLSGAVAFGKSVLLDAYVGYVVGTASTRASGSTPSQTVRVNGLTDMTVRGSLKLHGDDLRLTVGLNLPTGKTDLDSSQFAAMSVLASPVLNAASPVLGSGFSATAGVVGAKRIGAWAWGAGASYQYRAEYTPFQAAALGLGGTVSNVTLAPGSAVRLSVGGDGLVGQGAMAFSLAATIYTQDQLQQTLPGDTLLVTKVTLGPMFQGEWRWRLSVPAFRSLDVWAYDRYVSRYQNAQGQQVAGTNGNFFYFGANGLTTLDPSRALVTQVHGRWLTGLSIDNTLATAATLAFGAGIGMAFDTGGLTLTPMLGGEYGRINSGLQTFPVTQLQLAFTVAGR